MKSSVLVATTAALLATASPVDMEKRKYETSWVYVEQTVTVTGTETTPTAKPTMPFIAGEKQRPNVPFSPVPVPEPSPIQEPSTPSAVIVTVTASPSLAKPTIQPAPEPTSQTQTQAEQSTQAPPSSTESSAPASTSAPENPTSDGNDYVSLALSRHNLHRSNHSAPSVTWSDKLAGYAGITAATCVFKHDMDEGDKNYGQNLASWGESSGAKEMGEAGAIKMAITDFWYNGEFQKYAPSYYDSAGPDMSTFESWGHFSEMLWKDVTEIGCVSQFCPAGTMYDMDSWFTVCNYGPQGNIAGAYQTNVLKPLGKSILN
ncbi:PR-1-like protein [Hypoxylon sp. FL1284]|nr:PR-1-like protein [Hypoxylon sp. FL1284]